MTPTRRERVATRFEAVSLTMRWYNQWMKFVAMMTLFCASPALGLEAAQLLGPWKGSMVFVVKKKPHRAPMALEFKADGSAVITQEDQTQTLRYEIKGQKVLLRDPTRSGNDLVLRRIKVTESELSCELQPTDRSRRPPDGFSLRLELKRVAVKTSQ